MQLIYSLQTPANGRAWRPTQPPQFELEKCVDYLPISRQMASLGRGGVSFQMEQVTGTPTLANLPHVKVSVG